MKRFSAGMAAALLAVVLVFSYKVSAVSAEHGILLDAQTGRVLFEKGVNERARIASTTKIMTALVVCEQCNVLDRMRVPKEAVGIEGSSIYLKEGEVLTIQELLYGMMLHSGNDAATALAIYCGGTVEGFAQLMNDKAHRLGMHNTHFENPHGLDSPGHYSTAEDMAVLAAYAMENPIFAQTVSTKTVNITGRSLRNHNKLLWQVEGADGVKTGYTKAAGRILVSSATRMGRRLIAVTMNAPDDWNDHKALFSKGFSEYEVHSVIAKGEILGEIEVVGGTAGRVCIVADADFSYALAENEMPHIVLPGKQFVYAPVIQGERAGEAYICLDDKVIGKIPVRYSKTIEQQNVEEPPFWRRLFGGKTS